MDLQIKQIIDIDEHTLNTITTWMYDWWAKGENYSFEAFKCHMKHSLNSDRLPQTYGLFLNGNIIGMYQFVYEDSNVRPDIYPWLANLYIDEKYGNMGYGRKLIESVEIMARKNTDFKELFLYTKHIGLYEKFGWKFISEIDTYDEAPRIQRLYKLDLK